MYFRILDSAMEEMGDSLTQQADLGQSLQRIVLAVSDTIPGADHASITVRDTGGGLRTIAATSDLVRSADELQYTLREGPCYEAVMAKPLCYAPNLTQSERWPTFGPRVAELGLLSQLAVRLSQDGATVTGLNLYSTTRNAFDEDDGLPQMFASHARVALGYATELQNLYVALNSRETIGKAIGIVMERYDLTSERAFEFLIRTSQDSNTKLRDVALRIVQTREARALGAKHAQEIHGTT